MHQPWCAPGHKVAVLIRGIHHSRSYLHFGKDPVIIDFRRTARSIRERAIDPLRAACGADGRVDVFLTSYTSELQDEAVASFGADRGRCRFKDMHRGSTQARCMVEGLVMIADDGEESGGTGYDWVVVIRFDIALRQEITRLDVKVSRVNFMWREREFWGRDGCVCDVIHVLPGSLLGAFTAAVMTQPDSTDLHWLHRHITDRHGGDVAAFVLEEPFNTDTDLGANPVYVISRQPQMVRRSNCYLPPCGRLFRRRL